MNTLLLTYIDVKIEENGEKLDFFKLRKTSFCGNSFCEVN